MMHQRVTKRGARDLAAVALGASIVFGAAPKIGLFVPEILAVALAPWWWPAFAKTRYGPSLVALLCVAGVGYVSAFLIAGGRPGEIIIAVFRDAALVATAAAVVWREARDSDAKVFVLAALGGAALYGLRPSLHHSATYVWKFGLGAPVLLLGAVLLAEAAGRHNWRLYAWFTAVAVASAVLDFRSLALVSLGSAAVFLLVDRARSRRTAFALSAAILAAVIGIGAVYTTAVSHGWLGSSAQQRYQVQQQQGGGAGAFSVLGVARATTFTNVALVIDRPLIGRGTKPRLSNRVAERARHWAAVVGVEQSRAEVLLTWRTLAEHSLLFQAWVEGGVLAALLFLYLLFYVLPTGIARSSRTSRLTPLAIAGSVLGAWDMLFSPFAAVTVLALALTVGAVACSAVRREGVEC